MEPACLISLLAKLSRRLVSGWMSVNLSHLVEQAFPWGGVLFQAKPRAGERISAQQDTAFKNVTNIRVEKYLL